MVGIPRFRQNYLCGKMCDVHIEDPEMEDTQIKGCSLVIWADKGLKEKFEKIPGISMVNDFGNQYFIEIDHRYDPQVIKATIESGLFLSYNPFAEETLLAKGRVHFANDVDGKVVSVHIQHEFIVDENKNRRFNGLIVWADKGLKDLLEEVPGVYSVSEYGTKYFVKIDERYEIARVEANIETEILFEKGVKPKTRPSFITDEEKHIFETKLMFAICKCGHNIGKHNSHSYLIFHGCSVLDCDCKKFEWHD